MAPMKTETAATPSLPSKGGVPLKSSVEDKVNEQYDSDASMAFYEYVMGGGGDDIHYGIFTSDKDDLKTSSQNSIEALAHMAESRKALKKVCVLWAPAVLATEL
jgi:hypothetical protein